MLGVKLNEVRLAPAGRLTVAECVEALEGARWLEVGPARPSSQKRHANHARFTNG